jgi:ribosomal protein L14E/L6E/L27E
MSRKEVDELLAKVAAQGWRVDDRGIKALCFSPDGVTVVTIHKTNSDHRALRNAVSQLQRGGFRP